MAIEAEPRAATARRARVRVEGTVQGVGFRPYVFRLAHELGLAGFVLNDERGVVAEVEGAASAIAAFVDFLPTGAPPLAHVERVRVEQIEPSGEREFAIAASSSGAHPDAPVAADSATCGECLAELSDMRDRRFRYPFVNCTNCGPRFTIVRGVPYDRPLTTMADFRMCARCQTEYDDPLDRRFHAQPNACPECGPSLRLVEASGHTLGRRDGALRFACSALAEGGIVAVKGLGGFHLACRADDDAAVAELRARKHREDRPFALMAADLDRARALVELTRADEAALCGRERPIVIAPRRRGAGVAPAVAPGSADLGVMLPYSPLHHLLLDGVGATLVMTSGNVSDEPIAFEDDDALARLGTIADLVLLHDRPIHMRTDDSVVRVAGDRRIVVRRSRGFVPDSLALPVPAARDVLACGAELKNTFCLARGERAWLGHHIGDLKNYETLTSFRDGVEHFERLFAVKPEVVAHDMHPDYLSTAFALEREGVRHVAVQHHHAHLAACLAEHGIEGPAVGAIFDGAGLGSDGTIWGGELLVGGLDGFERGGHLWPVRQPGGDRAAREPWRMACAWLAAAGGAAPGRPPVLGVVDHDAWAAVARMARTGFAAPVTTSAGRLFDAVAALAGIRPLATTYEGQAAIELEAACDPHEGGSYRMPVLERDGAFMLDAREPVFAVAADAARGVHAGQIAARFHRGLADATSFACAALAERHGLDTVVLSGGVFQNRRLLEQTAAPLTAAGLRVLTPERVPPNDGGIAYGQAAVAAAATAGAAR
jgi:hydrogenase maturation protein HypF